MECETSLFKLHDRQDKNNILRVYLGLSVLLPEWLKYNQLSKKKGIEILHDAMSQQPQLVTSVNFGSDSGF